VKRVLLSEFYTTKKYTFDNRVFTSTDKISEGKDNMVAILKFS